MRGGETIHRLSGRLRRALDPQAWRATLRSRLRAFAWALAYAAVLLLATAWISSGLAALKSPLLDLGKAHVGDAIIAFGHQLSLTPIGIFMLAHALVGIKLMLGTLLLLGIGEGIHGRLRGRTESRDILDVALLVSAVGSVVAAGPVLAETHGLRQIIGELMLCVIASGLASFAQRPAAELPRSRLNPGEELKPSWFVPR